MKLAGLAPYRHTLAGQDLPFYQSVLPRDSNTNIQLVRIVVVEMKGTADPFPEGMWEELVVVGFVRIMQEGMCEGLSGVHALRRFRVHDPFHEVEGVLDVGGIRIRVDGRRWWRGR